MISPLMDWVIWEVYIGLSNLITDDGLTNLCNLIKLDLCDNELVTVNGIRKLNSLKYLNLGSQNNINRESLTDLINLNITFG